MSEPPKSFESAAEEARNQSLLGDFWSFLGHNKKWWLLPIIIVSLLLAFLILLSSGPAAPFIYTLF